MKIQNALVSNILDWSQRYFAHVTKFHRISNSIEICLVGRAPGPLLRESTYQQWSTLSKKPAMWNFDVFIVISRNTLLNKHYISVTRSFAVFFVISLNILLHKQSKYLRRHDGPVKSQIMEMYWRIDEWIDVKMRYNLFMLITKLDLSLMYTFFKVESRPGVMQVK